MKKLVLFVVYSMENYWEPAKEVINVRFNSLLLIALFFAGCAPVAVVKMPESANRYATTQQYESFALLQGDTSGMNNRVFISDLAIREGGFTSNCDYETILRLAEEKARQLGGNCLIITEHKEPDIWSSCHRIRGKVLRIDNPEDFEKTIVWHPRRPLKTRNFRGTADSDSTTLKTASEIKFRAMPARRGKTKIIIENVFNCKESFLAPSAENRAFLQRAQLHFDMTEVFTREFRKSIIEDAGNLRSFMANYPEIMENVLQEWAQKRIEYESEIATDPALQTKWDNWVRTELSRLQDYAMTEIEIN